MSSYEQLLNSFKASPLLKLSCLQVENTQEETCKRQTLTTFDSLEKEEAKYHIKINNEQNKVIKEFEVKGPIANLLKANENPKSQTSKDFPSARSNFFNLMSLSRKASEEEFKIVKDD